MGVRKLNGRAYVCLIRGAFLPNDLTAIDMDEIKEKFLNTYMDSCALKLKLPRQLIDTIFSFNSQRLLLAQFSHLYINWLKYTMQHDQRESTFVWERLVDYRTEAVER